MADGSGKPDTIVREANAAAADAAAEARNEVLDGANVQVPVQRKPRGSRSTRAGVAWREFQVNVWLTHFNDVEFGFYKHQRNQAKSRQFTSDMEIFAEVTEGGQRTGLLGYRGDMWKRSNGIDRRLVMKLFGEKLNWHASMDMMLGRSLQQTIGARGFPVTCFSLNIGSHDYVVMLERAANKWPCLPENFSFFLMDDGKPRFYRLRRALINLGGDYTLLDERDHVVGHIDGRLVTIGGYWQGYLDPEHATPHLMIVLQMFCGMLAFNRASRRHVRNLYRQIQGGAELPKLQRQETDLYMNPRRVR